MTHQSAVGDHLAAVGEGQAPAEVPVGASLNYLEIRAVLWDLWKKLRLEEASRKGGKTEPSDPRMASHS